MGLAIRPEELERFKAEEDARKAGKPLPSQTVSYLRACVCCMHACVYVYARLLSLHAFEASAMPMCTDRLKNFKLYEGCKGRCACL